MDEKKGQCPVKFLWHGVGLGAILMRAGLILAFIGALMKLGFMLSWHGRSISQFFFNLASLSWLSGKVLSMLIGMWANGHKKRLRRMGI